MNSEPLTFWDHLDVLRSALLRMVLVVVVLTIVAFVQKDLLFDVVLAPRSSDFVTYRLLGVDDFCISLMNTGLTEQFMIHMRTALYTGLLLASPYILYELFRFISPGLYQNERHYSLWIVGTGYLMFIIGTLTNYFLVFPLTLRFLGTYQVAPDVANMLTLQSYIDTLLSMGLVMGVVFELPVVSGLLGGIADGKPDEPIPPTRTGGYPDSGSHHYADDRRLHALCRGAAHLPALRGEHSRGQMYCKKRNKEIKHNSIC